MAKKKKGGKKRRSNRRKSKSKKKPIQRGVLGKVGALMVSVFPTAIAGTDAISRAMRNYKAHDLNVVGAAHFGLIRFVNSMSYGIIGVTPFNEVMQFSQKDGGSSDIKVSPGVPKFSLGYTIASGLALMGVDRAAAWINSNRPVKIMGTNYNATGGA